MTGTSFVSSVDLTVTRLGYFDDRRFSPSGLAVSHPVGIYNADTGQLLFSATVPAGTSAPLVNEFRMVNISNRQLEAGQEYVIATTIAGDAQMGALIDERVTPNPFITMLNQHSGGGAGLSFPATVLPVSSFRFGAVFEFIPDVPMPTPAWDVPNPSNGGSGNPNVFGTRFTPNEDITVSALGYYDANILGSQEGLSASHDVGIYDDSNFQLITSVTVPAGTVAERIGSHRYVDISPVILEAGKSYSIAATIAGDDTTNTTPGSSLVVDSRVSTSAWVGAFGATSLTFPATTVTTSTRVMGPGFLIAPVSACAADVNGDGLLTPGDFTAWINAFNNNLPGCDQNGDGACTPTDFTAWINNFNAGC
ncbi:MAG: hypothetical protein ED559_14045 [Phycisphaera sp.]|nr:MAG: hypothetical protein ED559_14045 [Phycisphaera sp.]